MQYLFLTDLGILIFLFCKVFFPLFETVSERFPDLTGWDWWEGGIVTPVPDAASYIRGWIQMVLAPNDLFSWNNKYNKYNNYSFTDTFTCFFLSYARQLTLCMLASRSHAGVVILGLLSSSHILSLPLSGINWRPLFPPRGSCPSFPIWLPHSQGPRTLPYWDPEQLPPLK
jgi:hypothetical protein